MENTKYLKLYNFNLTSKSQLVYRILLENADEGKRESSMRLKTIAKESSLSLSSVQRALNELLEVGLITKEARFNDVSGAQIRNTYKLPEIENDR